MRLEKNDESIKDQQQDYSNYLLRIGEGREK